MHQAKAEADILAATLNSTDSNGPLKDCYAPEKIFGLKETLEMIERRVSGEVQPAGNSQ